MTYSFVKYKNIVDIPIHTTIEIDMTIETAIIQGLWLDLLEKDDRISSECPEMVLITEDEFTRSIQYAIAVLTKNKAK